MIIIFSPDDDLLLNDFSAQKSGTQKHKADDAISELHAGKHIQYISSGIIKRTNTRDKKFLDTVVNTIEQRITDPQLSVEDLSRDLAMSRSSLHKKLKALSGHVPNEFIRIIRLKKAAQLVLSEEYNISEISYLVGFNSHSYFSKCFIGHFKMSPSAFLKKANKI